MTRSYRRDVSARTSAATGSRSASYASSTSSPARPARAAASVRLRAAASWMPVFMPSPPAMGWTCAASPARNTRPSRIRVAMRTLTRQAESQVASASRIPGIRAWRSNSRWKLSSEGGSSPPRSSCSGGACSWKVSVPGIGQSSIPPPSEVNHWCQKSRLSPGARTSPMTIAGSSSPLPSKGMPRSLRVVLRPPSHPAR
ncbi:hypothetical protein VR46_01750 [Streptomyces sp. NRRL S-444]|nr:hypothetical protein VR46_01750 [Streptomyces sp. NRRL S-444]